MALRDRHPRPQAVERDLARLADGTLAPSRRERTERRVAGSSELQARLREQRRAIAAARWVAQRERAPLALRIRHRTIPAQSRSRHPSRLRRLRLGLGPRLRRGLGLSLGLASLAAAMFWMILALGGGQAGLTVAQAATLASNRPAVSVAEPREDEVTLPNLGAAGLAFPYWEDHFQWHAVGARTDRVGGRLATTVFYRRDGQTIAYTIVSGEPLRGAATSIGTFSTAARHVVTWLRRGHTCVLSGRDVGFATLLRLATWRGHGRIPY